MTDEESTFERLAAHLWASFLMVRDQYARLRMERADGTDEAALWDLLVLFWFWVTGLILGSFLTYMFF